MPSDKTKREIHHYISPAFFMANYRQVHVKMYSDPKFERLSKDAKWLFAYLITCPHRNESALFTVTINRMCLDTGLTSGELQTAMSELQKGGMVAYDSACEVVWVINALKYQTINPKVKQSCVKDFEMCNSETLRKVFHEKYRDLLFSGNHYQTIQEPSIDPPLGIGIGLGLGLEGGVGETIPDEKQGEPDPNTPKPEVTFDKLVILWHSLRSSDDRPNHYETRKFKALASRFRLSQIQQALEFCGDRGWHGTLEQLEKICTGKITADNIRSPALSGGIAAKQVVNRPESVRRLAI